MLKESLPIVRFLHSYITLFLTILLLKTLRNSLSPLERSGSIFKAFNQFALFPRLQLQWDGPFWVITMAS